MLTDNNYHILLVEDDTDDAIFINGLLVDSELECLVEVVRTLEEGIQKLQQADFDLIFLDLILPDSVGFSTFEIIHKAYPQIPIVLLTNTNDDESVQKAICEGAQNFLVKGQFDSKRLIQSIQFSIERNQAILMILSNESCFRTIIDHNIDGIAIVDKQQKMLFVNNSAERIFDKLSNELIGRTFQFPIPKSQFSDVEIHHKNGQHLFVKISSAIIKWENETVYLVNLHDMTQQKNKEEKLKNLIIEKEILVKEIHHRVTNNFHLITSMFNLHTQFVSDEVTKDILKESSNRLNSMAIIHRQLYNSDNLAQIDVGHYIHTLVVTLFKSYASQQSSVVIEPRIDNVFLGIDKAIPVGLVVNELITNALKYAFPKPKDNKGKIAIELNQVNNTTICLTIKDTGIGLPSDLQLENTKSLGLQLVRMLVEDQLKGTIDVQRKNGTAFIINFQNDYN